MSPNNRLFLPKSLLLMLGGFVFAFVFFWASPVKSLYAQSVNLDQCQNDSPTCAPNSAGGWANGNINKNNSTYKEGDFVPFRYHITGLSDTATYCFGTNWDIVESGPSIAYDYIGTYNASVTGADPTLGIAGFSGAPSSTIPIPADPVPTSGTISSNPFAGTQQSGLLSMWGGTFASIGNYSNSGGAQSAGDTQSIEFCFTLASAQTEVIIAWGGHIGVGAEWGGLPRSSGSPYHMRTGTSNNGFSGDRASDNDLSCNESGSVSPNNIGNQDRSMKADAIESGTIKIVKNISTGSDATFTFDVQDSTPAQVANPSITTSGGMGMSKVIVVSPGIFSIEEILPPGYSLVIDDTSCVDAEDNGTLSGTTISGIEIVNEDNAVCTFTNEEDTLISLASFSATTTENVVSIAWITAAEVDNAGFNVYSSASVNGPWTKVNDALIPAEGSPSSTTSYSLVDEAGANYYMLEDVNTKGTTTQHSPVSANGSVSGTNSMLPTVFIPYF